MSSLLASLEFRLAAASCSRGLSALWPSSCIPAASADAATLINTDPCDNATAHTAVRALGGLELLQARPGRRLRGQPGRLDPHRRRRMWSPAASRSTRPDRSGRSSLYLPAGGSAQSPYTCVDFAYPTFRFFAKNNRLLSTVLVSIVYKRAAARAGDGSDRAGRPEPQRGRRPAADADRRRQVQSVVNKLLGHGDSAGRPEVHLLLTGSSQIDDVYVDPHEMR